MSPDITAFPCIIISDNFVSAVMLPVRVFAPPKIHLVRFIILDKSPE